ncbi:hypothetical protein IAT38_000817 [Cryptococcus sp. DSM 104549]
MLPSPLRTMAKQYDTIILGAGWAGAVASRTLAAKGHSVLVLEARDRIGGRARTWQGEGAKIDIGCSWIHGYKEGNPARGIAKEVGVNAVLPEAAEGVIYGPDGPLPKDQADALRTTLSTTLASTQNPHPAPPASSSLASVLLPPGTPALSAALARSLEIPLGLTLEQASHKWAGWEGATSYAGSDAAPVGGYESLVSKVFAASGADIKLNAEVTSVSSPFPATGPVTVTTKTGETFSAPSVLSTLPLGVLQSLPSNFFSPPLPPLRSETISHTHVGVLEKLLVQYPTAWWPRAAEVGSYTFLPTGPAPTETSSLEEIFSGSTLVTANFAGPGLPDKTPTLLTYLSETPARAVLKHKKEDVVAAWHAFLVKRFGAQGDVPKPTGSEVTNWLTDPFSLGATSTPSAATSGTEAERTPMDFKELGRPVWGGSLGFAGEHTDMENRGSVAGAVVSGLREGERVARFLALQREA